MAASDSADPPADGASSDNADGFGAGSGAGYGGFQPNFLFAEGLQCTGGGEGVALYPNCGGGEVFVDTPQGGTPRDTDPPASDSNTSVPPFDSGSAGDSGAE